MKVASTKYEVATLIFTIFMPENVYMYQIVFMTTIDTILFLSVLQKFYQAIDHLYEVEHQKLEHQLIILDPQNTGKITWMKFKPDLAPKLIKR